MKTIQQNETKNIQKMKNNKIYSLTQSEMIGSNPYATELIKK